MTGISHAVLSDLSQISPGASVSIYGAGEFGKSLLNRIKRERPDVAIPFLVDSRESGNRYGVDLLTPDALVRDQRGTFDYLIVASTYHSEILATLASLGVDNVYVADPCLIGKSASPALGMDENLLMNRRLWGDVSQWRDQHKYGYRWGGDDQQEYTDIPVLVERYVNPFLKGKSLEILEIAPGGGRLTAELVRIAKVLYLVDLNSACIDICKERFKYYENIEYFENDGCSLDMIKSETLDLVISYDSLVHADKEIIRLYVLQIAKKLRVGGVAWIHHSATGARKLGLRSNMTSELMRAFAEEAGLLIKATIYMHLLKGPKPHYGDCITVLERADLSEAVDRNRPAYTNNNYLGAEGDEGANEAE